MVRKNDSHDQCAVEGYPETGRAGDRSDQLRKAQGTVEDQPQRRKRLRYWLFQAARSAVSHAEEFRLLHLYYTTRADNPLKKMQSLIVIACKILRMIYTLLKNGGKYDPERMLRDIKHPAGTVPNAAA